MALVRFKDLCIDATDVEPTGAFWAAALGLALERLDDGDDVVHRCRLRGSSPEQTVWVNHVPEPRTVKQRVHLDVHARSIAEVEGFGARVLPGWETPWTVMADPEGGELCVFARDDGFWAERADPYRLYEVGVDAVDHQRVTQWWAEVLGSDADHEERDFSAVAAPGAPFEALVFQSVPEPKTVKNRIHWDVTADSGGVDALVRRGARVLREPDGEIGWTVMADPEGNEFCVFEEQ